MPVVSETVAWGWTVPKTVEVPQLPLVQFLEVIDTPVVLVRQVPVLVQTMQNTVKIPHAFLDMVLARRCCNDRCRMVETVQKTVESVQLVLPLSVSVEGVSQQRRCFLRCHGLLAILATATLLRRASLCRVSSGVWRKVSSPEVLRLLFCERRMRCGCVWCISCSSQWTG